MAEIKDFGDFSDQERREQEQTQPIARTTFEFDSDGELDKIHMQIGNPDAADKRTLQIIERETDTFILAGHEEIADDGERLNMVDHFESIPNPTTQPEGDDQKRRVVHINPETGEISIRDGSTTRELVDELDTMDVETRSAVIDKLLPHLDEQAENGFFKSGIIGLSKVQDTAASIVDEIAKKQVTTASIAETAAAAFASIDASNIMRSMYESIDRFITTAAEYVKNIKLPTINLDALQEIGKNILEFTRSNTVLITFVVEAKNYLNLTDQDDETAGNYFDESGLLDALRYLAYVYRETHGDEIDIVEKDGGTFLPDEIDAEVKQICRNYLAYHKAQGAESYKDTIQAFADSYTAGKEKTQTEITQSDEFSMMISKAAHRQQDIAAEGADGLTLYVGGGADIIARITDINGEKLNLKDEDKQIQDVIGDLIRRNGKPLNVTPAQIWREWKGLPSTATVDDDDIAQINEIMERLMFAPSELNFAEQIEKHKNLKQQSDFDYTQPAQAQRRATLITGVKDRIRARNGDFVEGYTIFDYPLWYYYSHVVGQIGTWSKNLLNPSARPIKRIAGKQGQKYPTKPVYSSRQKTTLQRYLLGRIAGILQSSKGKQATGAVLIDEIAQDNGFELTAQTTRTLRQNVETIFDEWKKTKRESGLIKWDIAKTGRKITGWTLTVTQPDKKP